MKTFDEWYKEHIRLGTNFGERYILKVLWEQKEAEIECLRRELADHRSGDCDLMKTIRRLERDVDTLKMNSGR
jgi:hypothetical protein